MKKIEINLTVEEINVILSALIELPFKQVSNLIVNIKEQAENKLKEVNE